MVNCEARDLQFMPMKRVPGCLASSHTGRFHLDADVQGPSRRIRAHLCEVDRAIWEIFLAGVAQEVI